MRSETVKPGLILARDFVDDVDPAGWLVGEKLDGVRAYWDGTQLLSRGGHRIAAPASITADLPPFPVDGELWMGRGRFEEVKALAQTKGDWADWSEARLGLFDMPHARGGFERRLRALAEWEADTRPASAFVIQQQRCEGPAHLAAMLADVRLLSGEGLVIRRPGGAYTAGRSPDMLRVLRKQTSEATVIGYRRTKTGKVRSLEVRPWNGRPFHLGGLTMAIRALPPTVGTEITFSYRGRTNGGLPRFAAFSRVAELRRKAMVAHGQTWSEPADGEPIAEKYAVAE